MVYIQILLTAIFIILPICGYVAQILYLYLDLLLTDKIKTKKEFYTRHIPYIFLIEKIGTLK